MPVAHSQAKVLPNYHNMDVIQFNDTLKARLDQESPAQHITTVQGFHDKVDHLTQIIQDTISSKVPHRCPCPFSKRWWNSDLTALRKKKAQLSKESYKH